MRSVVVNYFCFFLRIFEFIVIRYKNTLGNLYKIRSVKFEMRKNDQTVREKTITGRKFREDPRLWGIMS